MKSLRGRSGRVTLAAVLAVTVGFLGVCVAVKGDITECTEMGAELQVDSTIFRMSAISGEIGESTFSDLSSLSEIAPDSVVGGSEVRVSCTHQLQSETPMYEQFLRLSSDLDDVSFDADPPQVKPDEAGIWQDDAAQTDLWLPPEHNIHELTVTVEGKIPEPVETYEETVDGEPVTMRLEKETPIEVFYIRVMESTSGLDYADKPQTFVNEPFVRSLVLVLDCCATNAAIEDAKAQITGLHAALDEGDALRLPSDLLGTESAMAAYAEELLADGYPEQAGEVASKMTGIADLGNAYVGRHGVDPFMISTIVLAIALGIGVFLWIWMEMHRGRSEDENYE